MLGRYGIDAPGVVGAVFGAAAGGGLLTLAVWALLAPWHRQWAVPALLALTAAIATYGLFMLWSSLVGKLKLRDELVHLCGLKATDRLLDVGCGRGLLLIAAAREICAGEAVGIDIWRHRDQYANSPLATLENARREGVLPRVMLLSSDARSLPLATDAFDVVVSSLTLHNLPDAQARRMAVQEMYRVLKPGGRLAIFDIVHVDAYAETLERSGAQSVAISRAYFLFALPGRIVSAMKPCREQRHRYGVD